MPTWQLTLSGITVRKAQGLSKFPYLHKSGRGFLSLRIGSVSLPAYGLGLADLPYHYSREGCFLPFFLESKLSLEKHELVIFVVSLPWFLAE